MCPRTSFVFWVSICLQTSAGVYVVLAGDSGGNLGEEEYTMVPYSRNVLASDDRSYETTALVS